MRRAGPGQRGHLSADILLDANVLLEVELAEKHAEACKALLRIVERGELRPSLWTST
ncbi:MAG: hypothetical protein J7L75_02030 [Thermoproteales archaeon]|nr:hypothetical protein [Thermoproteales archaeon]